MTPQGEIIVGIGAMLAAFWIVVLTRKKTLTVGYGLFWLLMCLGAALLAVFDRALNFVTALVGAVYPVSAMTLLGFVVIVGILVLFSIRLSRLHMQVIQLTRYVGTLEYEWTHRDRPDEKPPA